MNGRNAKLLRKMRSNDRPSKRLWSSLSAEKKHQVREYVAAFSPPLDPIRRRIPSLAAILERLT